MKVVSSHLGRSFKHFPAKSPFQILLSFRRNLEMGAAFLMIRSPSTSSDFLFFPPFCFPSSPEGVTVVMVDNFLGGELIKLGVRVTLMELFMTISKTSSKQTRRSLTIKWLPNFLHSPSQRWMRISMAYKIFMGRLLLVAMRPLKMIFLVWMAVANDFTPAMSTLRRPNKMEVMPE
jgi:hypothetical protein